MRYLVLLITLLITSCTQYNTDKNICDYNSFEFKREVKYIVNETIEENQNKLKETFKECERFSLCLNKKVTMLKNQLGNYGCYVINGNKRIQIFDCEDYK